MIILGTNSIKDTGYNVANSVRFNSGDSAYMHKALGTPTSTKIGTLSTWFKRAKLNQEMNLLGAETDTNSRGYLQLDDGTNGILRFWWEEGGTVTNLITNRLFRDVSAWYHVVVAYDTSQSTASNRVKIYINGTQETSFSTETYPGQDVTTCPWNISGYNTSVGAQKGGSGSYGTFFDGYQAETVFIDGQQLAPTEFGEFDSDSPTIWKPKDVSGLTFGNNGFYLDYEDSANLGNDANGGTDFTEVNLAATDQSTDTCTNNFSTMNPLSSSVSLSSFTYTEGNLEAESDARRGAYSNIGVSSGKWYVEAKLISFTNGGSGTNLYGIGVAADTFHVLNDGIGEQASAVAYLGTGTKTVANSTSSFGNTYAANDIIGIALDLDNNKIYFSKNGTFQNSGDPTSGSTGTGAIGTVAVGSTPDGAYFFNSGHQENQAKWSFNFGSPAYAISSGNTDGNGYGNFEYAVPSGYFSINTKNLAEYG